MSPPVQSQMMVVSLARDTLGGVLKSGVAPRERLHSNPSAKVSTTEIGVWILTPKGTVNWTVYVTSSPTRRASGAAVLTRERVRVRRRRLSICSYGSLAPPGA